MNLKEYLKSGHTDTNGVHHEWSNFDLELLPSVGCVINNKNGDTFPLLSNGDIGFDEPMNVMDMKDDMFSSQEWFDSLGFGEDTIVDEVIDNLTEVDYLEMKAELHYGI